MVDFAALKKQHAARKTTVHKGMSVVLGVRGSGKSSAAAGTWGDKKVLLLQFSQESHAVTSARAVAKNPDNVFAVIIDINEVTGEKRNSAATLKALEEVLTDTKELAEFEVIVIDSLSVLDVIIAEHPSVKSATGYDKKRVTDELYDGFVNLLVMLRDKNTHFIVIMCPTELRGSQVEGFTETPTLRGGSAVNNVIGACNDILFVRQDTAEIKKNNELVDVTVHVFDMGVASQKTGTKVSKEKYTLPIKARVAGVKTNELPERMKADFTKLLEMKGVK